MLNNLKTDGYEERKLLRDMDLMEIIAIRQCIHNVMDKVRTVDHSCLRSKYRFITAKEIMDCISRGTIVEFHVVNKSCRVLLRNKNKTHNNDTCVVLDILTGTIITVYTNKSYDKHSTLREENYNKNLNIIHEILKNKY